MRLGRFAAHFASFGGRVTVVTASLEDYRHGFPKRRHLDGSLVDRLPPEVRIVRTEAVRPGWGIHALDRLRLGRLHRCWYTPDVAVRWRKAAVGACKTVHRDDPVDCIYTSSNPLSGHLVGLTLSKSLRLPWVAEFRDPWTESDSKSWESFLGYHYERCLQAKILRHTSKVVMNTPLAGKRLLAEFPWLDSQKLDVVTNSFEPEHIDAAKRSVQRRSDGRLVIAHVGTMRAVCPTNQRHGPKASIRGRLRRFIDSAGRYQHAQTRYDELGNSPWFICQALQRLVSQTPDLRAQIRLILAGAFAAVPNAEEQLGHMVYELGLSEMVEYLGELSHEDALTVMCDADVLLVNQAYSIRGLPCPVVAAKTYEYLAMGKPILGLLPPGDAKDFVLESGLGTVAAPNDPTEISEKVLELYREHINGGIRRTPNMSFIEQFRSDRLARRVWNLFQKITSNPSKRH